MKVIKRKDGSSFRRLLLMDEGEFEAALVKAKETCEPEEKQPTLADTYLANESIPAADRLAAYNTALARLSGPGAELARTVKKAKPETATVAAGGEIEEEGEAEATKYGGDEEDDGDYSDATALLQLPKADEKEEHKAAAAAPMRASPPLPDVELPIQYAAKANNLKRQLEKSGKVRVGRHEVRLGESLVLSNAEYAELVRSVYVHSSKGDSLSKRKAFLAFLAGVGVSSADLSVKDARDTMVAKAMPSSSQQGHGWFGYKRPSAVNSAKSPPGKRPRILFMYRRL